MQRGPTGLPRDPAAVGVPADAPRVRYRSAYSTEAPLVTDLVVPLDVLANPRCLTVERTGTVLGREAVLCDVVRTRRATPPFLQMGGTCGPSSMGTAWICGVDAGDLVAASMDGYPSESPERGRLGAALRAAPERPIRRSWTWP